MVLILGSLSIDSLLKLRDALFLLVPQQLLCQSDAVKHGLLFFDFTVPVLNVQFFDFML